MFGAASELIYGEFREYVAPGAFKRYLGGNDEVRALYEHDPMRLLGTRSAGTLTLQEDDTGLRFELSIPDTSYARDMTELVRRGDVAGMSFGFRCISDQWEMRGGTPTRTLLDVDVPEITVTSSPYYPDTTVALRSLRRFRARPLHVLHLATLLREKS